MAEFDNFLSPGRRGHLIGIGGVSMSSLAEVLSGMGLSITGSDMNDSANVESLRRKGIEVAAAAGAFLFHWPVLLVYGCTCLDELGKIPWVMYHYRKYKWVKDLTRDLRN